jgi:uncharacterized membrane protein YGL010W
MDVATALGIVVLTMLVYGAGGAITFGLVEELNLDAGLKAWAVVLWPITLVGHLTYQLARPLFLACYRLGRKVAACHKRSTGLETL